MRQRYVAAFDCASWTASATKEVQSEESGSCPPVNVISLQLRCRAALRYAPTYEYFEE